MTATRLVPAIAAAILAAALVTGAGCAAPDRPSGTGRGLSVAGYLVPWDPRSRVPTGDKVLTEVSPVWYRPTPSGTVEFASPTAQASVATVTADADAEKVPLAPSISNFRDGRWDGALVADLVTDPARRTAHVTAIADLVRSRHWPAIDIDYESLPAASRSAYSAFITELGAALDRVPARLSVTVHAKTAEPGNWTGAQAQDWRAIGAAADHVRVMAYDHAYPQSPPGPVAPSPWVDQVLALATRTVPRDRIVLGVPTYGYDWAAGADGEPVQWADVQDIARDHDVTHRWDGESSSPSLRYTDGQGLGHTVWYENARSLGVKLDLARRHGVTGVALWHLGGEDPGSWPALRVSR